MRRTPSVRSISAVLLVALLLITCLIVPAGNVSAGESEPLPPAVIPDTTKTKPTCGIVDQGLPILDLVLTTLAVL
jgi:hypothetical protein